jgi:hypothetical protein
LSPPPKIWSWDKKLIANLPQFAVIHLNLPQFTAIYHNLPQLIVQLLQLIAKSPQFRFDLDAMQMPEGKCVILVWVPRGDRTGGGRDSSVGAATWAEGGLL